MHAPTEMLSSLVNGGKTIMYCQVFKNISWLFGKYLVREELTQSIIIYFMLTTHTIIYIHGNLHSSTEHAECPAYFLPPNIIQVMHRPTSSSIPLFLPLLLSLLSLPHITSAGGSVSPGDFNPACNTAVASLPERQDTFAFLDAYDSSSDTTTVFQVS